MTSEADSQPGIPDLPAEILCASIVIAEKIYPGPTGSFVIAGAMNRLGTTLILDANGWIIPNFVAAIFVDTIPAVEFNGAVWVRIIEVNGQPDSGTMRVSTLDGKPKTGALPWGNAELQLNIGPILLKANGTRIFHANAKNTATIQVEIWLGGRLACFRRLSIVGQPGGVPPSDFIELPAPGSPSGYPGA